jgi:sugar phosphate isomerase/epimerase
MTIRIGNQTAYMALPPTLPFDYAVSRNFDAFEWFPDKKPWGEGFEINDIDASMRAIIKSTAQTRGISMSVHAPVEANPLLPRAQALLSECTGFAFDIGAVLINIHLHAEEGFQRYVEAVRPAVELTRKYGLRLSIENTPECGPEDFNALFLRLKELKIPVSHVGMCLDTGHANLHPATRNDYLRYIDSLAPHVPIIHVHMHENRGDRDAHLTVFTGPAADNPEGVRGIVRRLLGRGFSGAIIMEQWPEPPELLDNAREKLLKMINSDAGG